jgi:hypothetical protein
MRERDHFEEPGIEGRIILRSIMEWDLGGGGMTELICLRIGTGGGHL